MRFRHPDHPGRSVRLAYCLNLHPSEDLAGLVEGLRTITRPLRDRLLGATDADSAFGVGMYLPAKSARHLASERGAVDLERLANELHTQGLDPFTANAFPFGGFHDEGLKERVFRPTWMEPERLQFTLDVARIGARLLEGRIGRDEHLSISTHCGGFGTDLQSEADRNRVADGFLHAALELARLEEGGAPRTVLSLEPEPRSACGNTAELVPWRTRLARRCEHVAATHGVSVREVESALARHLGTCLDACHAAVEFEAPESALADATSGGATLGKLQFTNALRLVNPGANPAGRAALEALAEPVFLHQVTGGGAGGALHQAADLPEFSAILGQKDDQSRAWLDCEEWRCHFHVPVDLWTLADPSSSSTSDGEATGLGTTRDLSDSLLDHVLASPATWGLADLHLEIETYTWSVLPGSAKGQGNLVDGLEREYRHVLARLAQAGWKPATSRGRAGAS